MATLELPVISPDAENWTLTYNTQTFTSDLNGAIQTAELPGARWSVSMTFSNRTGRAAWSLQATLGKLAGRAGRFYVTPVDWERRAGNTSGTGLVATDTSGGTSIPTDGWDAEVDNLFYAGSYFEVNGELKMVTADVSSDVDGLATIEFCPPLRKPVTDGMQIRYVEPRCTMMLSGDDQANWNLSAPVIYATSFDAMEALDI